MTTHGNVYNFTVNMADRIDASYGITAAGVESLVVCAIEHMKAGNHGRKACYLMSLKVRTEQPQMSGADRRNLVAKAYHVAMIDYHKSLIG